MLECKQSQIQQFFFNSRENNSSCFGPITAIIEIIKDLMVMYILTKFGADWLIIVDAIVSTKSNVAIFLIQG